MKKEQFKNYHLNKKTPYYFRIKCFFNGHSFIEHFTGRKGRIAEIWVREVDYFYCENCWLKDPQRCEYPIAEKLRLEKLYNFTH